MQVSSCTVWGRRFGGWSHRRCRHRRRPRRRFSNRRTNHELRVNSRKVLPPALMPPPPSSARRTTWTRRCPLRPTAVNRQPWTDTADGGAGPAPSRAADTVNNPQLSPVMDDDAALSFGAPLYPAMCIRGGRRAPERPCSRGELAPAHGHGQPTLERYLETVRTQRVWRLWPPSPGPHPSPRSL